jgi:hypothetical protein
MITVTKKLVARTPKPGKGLQRAWSSLLVEACRGSMRETRLREIADLILYDGDDRWFRVRMIEDRRPVKPSKTGAAGDDTPVVAARAAGLQGSLPPPQLVLTPVERLLRFVRQTLSKLKRTQSIPGRYDASHRPALCNLRDLLGIVLEDERRVLSQLERVQLHAQQMTLSRICDVLDPAERDQAWERARTRLSELECQSATLGERSGPEADHLRAWFLYQRTLYMLDPRQRDYQGAVRNLQTLLSEYPYEVVPFGVYFKAARAVVFRLPTALGTPIMATVRENVAFALATMPPRRLLDRIGACILLAEDAARSGATQTARRFVLAGLRLLDSWREGADGYLTAGMTSLLAEARLVATAGLDLSLSVATKLASLT